jgi:hypothetical protein
MTQPVHATPLHAYVHTSFRAAFGEPHNTLQKDDHWALQSKIINQPINVLVNGTPKTPAVWVFDPHQLATPVYVTALNDENAVDAVIVLIQNRVKRVSAEDEKTSADH